MSILKQKLEHYNQWLMDPKRELTAIYPGYEEPSGYTGEALGSPGLSKDLNEINDLGTGADRKVKKPNRIKELRSAQKPVALSTGAPTIDTSVKTSHTQGNNMPGYKVKPVDICPRCGQIDTLKDGACWTCRHQEVARIQSKRRRHATHTARVAPDRPISGVDPARP